MTMMPMTHKDRVSKRMWAGLTLMIAMLTFPALVEPAWAQNDEALMQRIERLEREVNELKELLSQRPDRETQAPTVARQPAPGQSRADNMAAPPTPRPTDTSPKRRPTTSWHLGGYADAGLVASDSSANDSFNAGSFNPIFLFQFKDFLLIEAELETSVDSEGKTDVELEYSQINLILHDSATLVMGKFLSPIGRFQEALHPAWINKLPNAPAGFGHDGVQPESEVGIQLRGGIPIGATKLTYAFVVGNGPQLGHEGAVELEGFGDDNNSNKSLGGRIGFFPLPSLEVGVSYLTAKVSGEEGLGAMEPTMADFDLWGIDAAYISGPLEVRFEYLNSDRDGLFSATAENPLVSALPGLSQEAWYAQLAYRLSDVGNSTILHNFEPVFRIGEVRAEGNDEREDAAHRRINIGLNYWFAPSAVMKGTVEWRNFKNPLTPTDTRFEFQFAYGF